MNDNGDFTDDEPMKPYKDGYQIGYFGTDDPATAVAERQPFVVEIRKDVPIDPLGGDRVGKKADFVNIGLISSCARHPRRRYHRRQRPVRRQDERRRPGREDRLVPRLHPGPAAAPTSRSPRA